MPNDAKPSTSYVDDPEANLANAISGRPIGLLLALTFGQISGETYVTDTEPSTSFTQDTKP